MEHKMNNKARYYIIAQNKNGLLEIGITGQPLRLSRTAREVILDSELLNNFLPKDIALIGVIVGMECQALK